MSFSALAGVENLGKTKQVAKKKVEPKAQVETVDLPQSVPVRVPRTTPAAKQELVEELSEPVAGAIVATNRLGKSAITTARREQVLAWMLNGHQHEGELMSLPHLADALESPLKVVENDVVVLKQKMADYYIKDDQTDTPALAHMLMEMKFQDRGRALALYNIVMADIRASDEQDAVWQKQNPDRVAKQSLSGRDRASMYNAALQAMDLAGKATNGMDQLFKLTGGVKKLEKIILHNTQIINNNHTTIVHMNTLQNFVETELAGILPSSRKIVPQLSTSSALEITPEDEEVLTIGDK